MEKEHFGLLFNNIFPELTYIVDRNATPSWSLDNLMRNYNIMLVYGGHAEFCCNGSIHPAKRGDLVFYKPGDQRKARTFPGNPVKCYAVDFNYTCPVYINGEWKIIHAELPLPFFQSITDEHLFSRLLELLAGLAKSALMARKRADAGERAIFTEILLLLIEYSGKKQYNYSSMRKVEKVISYMTENYSRQVTLRELAGHANICPSYLGSIFKSITGRSTIDYLIEIRINKAKNLLADGFTVSETSRLVGFNDIYYFSRTFKKHVGISPSRYAGMHAAE